MNKYYTPETKELKEIYTPYQYRYNYKNSSKEWLDIEEEDYYDRLLSDHIQVRVKYLDRSDIESLGYGIIQDEHNCQWFKNANGNIEIGLENDYHLTIRFTQSFGLFSGTIKNKSELKRLLKQLGT